MKPLNEKMKELRLAKGFTLRSFAKEIPMSFVA
jgi:transcriptional regulator with XRE-family HTH domain